MDAQNPSPVPLVPPKHAVGPHVSASPQEVVLQSAETSPKPAPSGEEIASRELEAAKRNVLSNKALELNRVLLERTTGKVHALLERMLYDEAILSFQSYANTVTIRRLGFNDHGPVHARIVTHNALKILELLRRGGVRPSLVADEVGTFEDSQVAVALGCFLHDLGMGVAREAHEWHSCELADEFIRTFLEMLYPGDLAIRCALRAMCREAIVGHMATVRIHSVEAGIVLVADGSDMARGRSRIPQLLSKDPSVGDIHRHSASAIARVDVLPGETKPVRIDIQMDDLTGIFQVEEVFMTKVKASPIMPHLEICVLVRDQPPRFYLR